jgi:hypothetical protein
MRHIGRKIMQTHRVGRAGWDIRWRLSTKIRLIGSREFDFGCSAGNVHQGVVWRLNRDRRT